MTSERGDRGGIEYVDNKEWAVEEWYDCIGQQCMGKNKRDESDQRDEAAAFDNQFTLLIDTSPKLRTASIQRYRPYYLLYHKYLRIEVQCIHIHRILLFRSDRRRKILMYIPRRLKLSPIILNDNHLKGELSDKCNWIVRVIPRGHIVNIILPIPYF